MFIMSKERDILIVSHLAFDEQEMGYFFSDSSPYFFLTIVGAPDRNVHQPLTHLEAFYRALRSIAIPKLNQKI